MVKPPSIEESGPAAQSSLPTTEVPSPSRSHCGSITDSPDSLWTRANSHFGEEITLVHADLPMIACALVSGICDSSAYNAWTCFVSMQTGMHFCNSCLPTTLERYLCHPSLLILCLQVTPSF